MVLYFKVALFGLADKNTKNKIKVFAAAKIVYIKIL